MEISTLWTPEFSVKPMRFSMQRGIAPRTEEIIVGGSVIAVR